jgi:glutathione synthase/RimK-type ligase-like ATP-grasp enzyme
LTSLLLEKVELLQIKHDTFSLLREFHPPMGNTLWAAIEQLAARYNFDIICKPNNGTGGASVIHTHTVEALKELICTAWSKQKEIALCT